MFGLCWQSLFIFLGGGGAVGVFQKMIGMPEREWFLCTYANLSLLIKDSISSLVAG